MAQPARPSARPETRQAIMTAAERMFAQEGFAPVGVRQITAAAGANIAAINYHFGDKDALILAIFRSRAQELSRARLEALRAAEAAASPAAPDLRAVLEALLGVTLRWLHEDGPRQNAIRFLVRARAEGPPAIQAYVHTNVELLLRFADALGRARPDLPREEAYWRLFFTLALEHDICVEAERLRTLSGGACDPDGDVEATLTRALDFAVAGFDAPVRRAP